MAFPRQAIDRIFLAAFSLRHFNKAAFSLRHLNEMGLVRRDDPLASLARDG
jgi:hypothetical protein